MGDSAGGHLALSTALVTDISDESGSDAGFSSEPNALYALYPVVEMTGPIILSLPFAHPDPVLGHPKLSPLLLAQQKILPPTVVYQGTADSGVLNKPADAAEFCRRANIKAGGTRCYYLTWDGAEHAFIEEAIGEGAEKRGHYAEVAANIDSFLGDLGYLPGIKSELLAKVKNSNQHCREWTYSTFGLYAQNYGYAPLSGSAW